MLLHYTRSEQNLLEKTTSYIAGYISRNTENWDSIIGLEDNSFHFTITMWQIKNEKRRGKNVHMKERRMSHKVCTSA